MTAQQNRDRAKPIAAEIGWDRMASMASEMLPDEPFSAAAFRLAIKRALRMAGVAATNTDAINTIAHGEGVQWTHQAGMWRRK